MEGEELTKYLQRRLASCSTARLSKEVSESAFLSHMLKVFADTIHDFRQTHWQKLPGFPEDHWDAQAFTPEEQAVLAYYYPLAPCTKESPLLEHCLSTALRTPIKVVQEKHGKKIAYDGTPLDAAILDYDAVPAGTMPDERVNYHVNVGPLKNEQLPHWVCGGRKRWFLENGLLPLWLAEREIYSIELMPEKNTPCLSGPEELAYLDLNLEAE